MLHEERGIGVLAHEVLLCVLEAIDDVHAIMCVDRTCMRLHAATRDPAIRRHIVRLVIHSCAERHAALDVLFETPDLGNMALCMGYVDTFSAMRHALDAELNATAKRGRPSRDGYGHGGAEGGVHQATAAHTVRRVFAGLGCMWNEALHVFISRGRVDLVRVALERPEVDRSPAALVDAVCAWLERRRKLATDMQSLHPCASPPRSERMVDDGSGSGSDCDDVNGMMDDADMLDVLFPDAVASDDAHVGRAVSLPHLPWLSHTVWEAHTFVQMLRCALRTRHRSAAIFFARRIDMYIQLHDARTSAAGHGQKRAADGDGISTGALRPPPHCALLPCTIMRVPRQRMMIPVNPGLMVILIEEGAWIDDPASILGPRQDDTMAHMDEMTKNAWLAAAAFHGSGRTIRYLLASGVSGSTLAMNRAAAGGHAGWARLFRDEKHATVTRDTLLCCARGGDVALLREMLRLLVAQCGSVASRHPSGGEHARAAPHTDGGDAEEEEEDRAVGDWADVLDAATRALSHDVIWYVLRHIDRAVDGTVIRVRNWRVPLFAAVSVGRLDLLQAYDAHRLGRASAPRAPDGGSQQREMADSTHCDDGGCAERVLALGRGGRAEEGEDAYNAERTQEAERSARDSDAAGQRAGDVYELLARDACSRGHTDIVHWLRTERGIRVDMPCCLHEAARNGHLALTEYLLACTGQQNAQPWSAAQSASVCARDMAPQHDRTTSTINFADDLAEHVYLTSDLGESARDLDSVAAWGWCLMLAAECGAMRLIERCLYEPCAGAVARLDMRIGHIAVADAIHRAMASGYPDVVAALIDFALAMPRKVERNLLYSAAGGQQTAQHPDETARALAIGTGTRTGACTAHSDCGTKLTVQPHPSDAEQSAFRSVSGVRNIIERLHMNVPHELLALYRGQVARLRCAA